MPSRTSRSRLPLAVVLVGATIAATLAGCSSKAAKSTAATSSAAGPVTADTAYYKGKTVNWDVPDPPGTGFYTTATILAPVVGKALGATVNIVSIPAGGTIAGQDQAATASADGLTFGSLNVSTDVANAATKQPNINFDITKVPVIAGLPINPEVFVVSPSSPYSTWDALVKAAPTTKSVTVPGSNEVIEKGLYGAWGIKAKMITGYEAVPDEVAGFLRGDAALGANSTTSFASSIAAGKAKPLLVTAPILPGTSGYDQLKDVPTIASELKSNPPKTPEAVKAVQAMEALFGQTAVNQVYFCPVGTSPARVAALTAAFKTATADPAVQAAFIKANLTPGYLSPAQSTQAITTDISEEASISSAASSYPY